MIEALLWIFKQLHSLLFCTFIKNKIVKLIKVKYTSYQCYLFSTSWKYIFILSLAAYILREWRCMPGRYSEVLIWPDNAVLLGWDLHLHWWMAQLLVLHVLGASDLKLQGAKPLFRSIALALAVSYLPVQPYDAVQSLRKASPNRPGMLSHW